MMRGKSVIRLGGSLALPFLIISIISIYGYNSFAARSEIGYPRMMQGPMVGAVTDSTILIWLRANGNFPCVVEYDTDPNFTDPKPSKTVTASKQNDYCVVIPLENLQPDTRYYYRVKINGGMDAYVKDWLPLSTKTAPAADSKARFRVGYGSCARVQEDPVQPIWTPVIQARPDLFFWIGDNVYADTTDPDIIAETYRSQREVTKLLPIQRSIPQLAVWDDHDYGLNDHDRTNPIKEDALRVFQQYWANPSYGLPNAPGVFFAYSYGGVDFFFVDCRYHRDPDDAPDTETKTFLGKEQLQWLKDGLKKSDSPFKVIVSGSGWTVAKGEVGDAWSAYLHERNHLFDFIRDESISGVVLLSGDTHVGELNAIPWSENGGYDLYDLVSSPLAQSPGDSWTNRRPEIRIRPVYGSGENFGLIEFDLRERPTLTFNLFNRFGQPAWEPFVLYADELVNGVESWSKKITEDEMKRVENVKAGKDYYTPLK